MKTKNITSKKEASLDGCFISINGINYALLKIDNVSPTSKPIITLTANVSAVDKWYGYYR